MKREFRVTIEAKGNNAAEEFLATLNKMADKAEWDHGINVDVKRVDTTEVPDASFQSGAEYGD